MHGQLRSPERQKLNKQKFDSTSLLFNSIYRYFSTGSSLHKNQKLWLDSEIFIYGNEKKFAESIYYSGKIQKKIVYNILLKMKKGDIYYMIADKQKNFQYSSLNDIQFKKLFVDITDFINATLEEYPKELEYEFDNILLDFWPLTINENLKVPNLDRLDTDSSLNKTDVLKVKREFNVFGPNLEIQGVLLDIRFNSKGMLEIFGNILKEEKDLVNFVEKFNKEVINKKKDYLGFGEDNCEIYNLKLNNRFYIIICNKKDNNVIEKSCYNLFGSFVNKVKDTYSLKDNTDTASIETFVSKRVSRNTVTYFNEEHEILRLERKITFDSITNDVKHKNEGNKSKDWIPNPNIGVLDLEAYTDEDNSTAKAYAIGFYSNKDLSCNTYYIDKSLNSVELVHKCINDMLKDKYKDVTFYVHNLGRYDSAFILKSLILYNSTDEGRENPYIIKESILRNSDMIKLVIRRKIDGKIRTIKLHDSAAILANTLADLCKSYGIKNKKGNFPYIFCNEDTLFYVGSTPDIKFYNNISKEQYKLLYKEVWSLKEEALEYLNKDLYSLKEVIDKVNKVMFLLFRKQMTNSLTISGFSARLFLEDFYDKDKAPLPLIVKRPIWLDVHKAYYGGRNEVFTPIVKDKIVYYYDVNSLYPYAMLNPMSGLNWLYVELVSTTLGTKNKIELNDNLFGWFYCKVKTSNHYLGLLPYRNEDGSLTFPNGMWYGWYFSEELKFAANNGYEIEILKGYITDISYNAFDKFVKLVFGIKADPRNKAERNAAKLILNSGIGRYGMDYLKPVTNLLNEEQHNIILASRILKNSLYIGENYYLDTYLPGVNKDVCKENGVDYTKVLNIENLDEKSNLGGYSSVSISTAAATLAYSRIHMAKILLYILEHKGIIYYMDTDSITTNLKLPIEFVDPNELGKLKLEHTIIEGYFVADKTYCIRTVEGEIIKRAKGVKAESLTVDDYKKMYKGETVFALKESSSRDYTKGSVIINISSDVKLNPSNYTKRVKVYDNNNKWIDTKPLYINAIDLSLMEYKEANKDYIWYNTCSTDFVMWYFVMYNTILPTVIPSFILIELDLVIWFPTKPIESSKLQVNCLIAPLSLIIWNKPKTYIIIYQSKGILTKTKPVNISKLRREFVLNKKGCYNRTNTKPHYLNIVTQIRSYSTSTDKSLIKPTQYTLDDLVLNITRKERKQIKEIIEDVKEKELFKTAFTHTSCIKNKNLLKSYETLEFYGDSLLNYFTTKFLYLVYPNYNEGDFSKLRSLMVSTKNLSKLSQDIRLYQYLEVDKTVIDINKLSLLKTEKLFADIFESFVAMLYLEKGKDVLLKFLSLTVFNTQITKDKREEFNKLNIKEKLDTNIPLLSKDHNITKQKCLVYSSSSPVQLEAQQGGQSLNNKELFKENSDKYNCEDVTNKIIPLDIKSMNQITFKFEDLKTNENNHTLAASIESLLNKNHQIIIKELIKLQTIHDRIIDLNSNIKNELIININKELSRNRNLHTLQTNEFKNIIINQKNLFVGTLGTLETLWTQQIENINKSISSLSELEIKILEQNKFLANRQFKLNVILAIFGLILILFELHKSYISF